MIDNSERARRHQGHDRDRDRDVDLRSSNAFEFHHFRPSTSLNPFLSGVKG